MVELEWLLGRMVGEWLPPIVPRGRTGLLPASRLRSRDARQAAWSSNARRVEVTGNGFSVEEGRWRRSPVEDAGVCRADICYETHQESVH